MGIIGSKGLQFDEIICKIKCSRVEIEVDVTKHSLLQEIRACLKMLSARWKE